ncbi:hypothetical protein RFI_23064, partial [Reticulomyxa filosa]
IRKSFLNQFMHNNEFIKLVTAPTKDFLAFITFFQEQKIIWKEQTELLTTIENYSRKILYEKDAIFGLVGLLWNVNKFHCFKLELNDSSNNERRKDLIKELLEKGQTNLNNLEVWIQFFNYSIEKNEDEWKDLLTDSLKEWWNADNFGERPSGKLRHRKALWFLRPRYNKIPNTFRDAFEKL